jgi:MFS superfamily sulfate permease-like transporter
MMLELVKMDGNLLFIGVDSVESIEEFQDEDGETITLILTKNAEPHYVDMPAVSVHNEWQTLMELANEAKFPFKLS